MDMILLCAASHSGGCMSSSPPSLGRLLAGGETPPMSLSGDTAMGGIGKRSCWGGGVCASGIKDGGAPIVTGGLNGFMWPAKGTGLGSDGTGLGRLRPALPAPATPKFPAALGTNPPPPYRGAKSPRPPSRGAKSPPPPPPPPPPRGGEVGE